MNKFVFDAAVSNLFPLFVQQRALLYLVGRLDCESLSYLRRGEKKSYEEVIYYGVRLKKKCFCNLFNSEKLSYMKPKT